MNPVFQFPSCLLQRQVFALTGKFRFYNPSGNLVMFSEQKMFKLREDIRVYSDESKTQEVLSIKARQTIDFTMDPSQRLDRRLGIAADILLAAIEGRQSN